MGYRRLLLTRWSRRDWLAVGLVALTALFLVGAGLTLVTTGDAIREQTRALDTGATVTYDPGEAPEGLPEAAIVLPVAEVSVAGEPATVVGVPPDAPRTVPSGSLPWAEARLVEPPGDGTVRGPVTSAGEQQLTGDRGTVTATVTPARERSVLPPDWYVTDPATVDRLGRSARLVIRPDGGDGPGTDSGALGVTLLSVAMYLLAGARGLVQALALVTIASSLLVAVSLYSVTRMTVRDRLETVFVARATGAPARQLIGLFALRTGCLAATGVVLGAAVGVIAVNVAVNAAVSLGVVTTLSPRVTGTVVRVLAPALVVLVAIGTLAGAVATWVSVRGPPAALEAASTGRRWLGARGSRLAAVTELRLLGWRVLAPTTAALTVFATVVLLSASVAGALAPLVAPAGGTITDTGAPNPLASSVDRDTVQVLRSQGVAASPETIVPQVRDGQPYLARGAEFGAFANLTGATLVAGREPAGPREAVIGGDLAATLDVGVGDRITLGGGTGPGVDRVRIVGRYRAPGLQDDQLVIPLDTATHLSNIQPGSVQLIRVRGLERTDRGETGDGGDGGVNGSVVVTGLSVPERATVAEGITVTATVRNYGAQRVSRDVTVTAGDVARTTRVAVGSGRTSEAAVTLPVSEPGTYTVTIDGLSERVVVERAARLSLSAVPERAPPSATLLVTVSDGGDPVRNATVTVGERTARTNRTGVARVTVPAEPGPYTVAARAGERSSSARTIAVARNATRRPLVDLAVSPSTVALGSRATARVALRNPWTRPLASTVTVRADDPVRRREVDLGPGGEATVTARLPAAAATGERTVVATIDGTERARATYRVTGDDRVVSALARGGQYVEGSAVSRGIEGLVGNLQLLQATLVALATLMVLGTAVAGFAGAVSARRQTIGVHRVTGASPRRVLRHVAGDAARIGAVASLLAVGLAVLALGVLNLLDALTLFGIRIGSVPPLPWLGAAVVGGVVLAVLSAVLATAGLVVGPPGRLLETARDAPDDSPGRGGQRTDGGEHD